MEAHSNVIWGQVCDAREANLVREAGEFLIREATIFTVIVKGLLLDFPRVLLVNWGVETCFVCLSIICVLRSKNSFYHSFVFL